MNLYQTGRAHRDAEFEPKIPPPEGWTGEPWLHPANVNAYLEETRRPYIRLFTFFVIAYTTLATLSFVFTPPGFIRSGLLLASLFSTLILYSLGLRRARERYFPNRSMFSIRRDEIYGRFLIVLIAAGMLLAFVSAGIGLRHLLLPITCILVVGPIAAMRANRSMPKISPVPLCAKCQYDLTGTDQTSRCSECGANLRDVGGVTLIRKPERKNKSTAIIAGITIPFIVVTASTGPLFAHLATILPTGALLALATQEPAFLYELDTRPLTTEQRSRLTERVIDSSLSNPLSPNDQRAWIANQVIAGAVDPIVADRYFASKIEIIFDAPDQARVGEPVLLSLQAETKVLGGRLSFGVFTTGISINRSDPILIFTHDGRNLAEQATSAFDFDPTFTDSLNFTQGPNAFMSGLARTRPAITHTFDQPGTTTLTTTVILTAPVTFPQTITHHDDGTYTITPQPIWHEKRTLTHTIEVKPAP